MSYSYGSLTIGDSKDRATVTVAGMFQGVPQEYRRELAQALAGEGYRVITADSEEWKIGYDAGFTAGEKYAQRPQPDRPEPVDPASVRVGDVVEIEANDGSWMVRGPVSEGDEGALRVRMGSLISYHALWDVDATVRILHAVEPEPDEAAVEAMARALHAADRAIVHTLAPIWDEMVPSARDEYRDMARTLIRDHGVHVWRCPMPDGYMDAAAVPVPDAGDDTLRAEMIEAAVVVWQHRSDERITASPTEHCAAMIDALLPRIREHVTAAVQAERERVRVSPENDPAIVDQVARAIHDSAQQDEPNWTDWDERSEEIRGHWRPYARAALAAMNARAALDGTEATDEHS